MAARLVLVDDNAHFLAAAQDLLEREGLDVVAVTSTGDEAARLVRELRPDGVLVDIDLGPESGFDVAHRLTGEHGVRVVLISAYTESEFAELIADSPALWIPLEGRPLREPGHGPPRAASDRMSPQPGRRGPTRGSPARAADSTFAVERRLQDRTAAMSPRTAGSTPAERAFASARCRVRPTQAEDECHVRDAVEDRAESQTGQDEDRPAGEVHSVRDGKPQSELDEGRAEAGRPKRRRSQRGPLRDHTEAAGESGEVGNHGGAAIRAPARLSREPSRSPGQRAHGCMASTSDVRSAIFSRVAGRFCMV